MSFCSVLSFTASKHEENFFTNFFNGIFGQRATHGKFDISSFQISISPSLGLHFESNSHPWGKLVGTHNSLYRITERLQRVIIGDRKIMVPTNFVNFPSVKDVSSSWIFSVAGNLTHAILPKVPLNCFKQCLQQCKLCNART